ncbi:MAG: ABC transporter ATP-binding protein [Clostridiaceae bacterium]
MVIDVKNLVKRYGDLIALDHFDLEVKEGEILGLLGPNGCGKTTAINCILGLLKYDKGNIKLWGKEMSPSEYDLKGKIGLVPQEVAVFENLTVYENIDYFCSMYIKDKAERKEKIDKVIDFVGLKDYLKFRPGKLSGGLKRRLNIACGIAHGPELIIMDEPTVAVDAQSRNFILEGIKRLNAEGATVLYTTHYLEEAEEICTRIVIMDNAKNVASGTNESLKNLISTTEIIIVKIINLTDDAKARLKEIPHLTEIKEQNGEFELHFEKGSNNLTSLLKWMESESLSYEKLYTKQPTLNEVFLALTGKELRD